MLLIGQIEGDKNIRGRSARMLFQDTSKERVVAYRIAKVEGEHINLSVKPNQSYKQNGVYIKIIIMNNLLKC